MGEKGPSFMFVLIYHIAFWAMMEETRHVVYTIRSWNRFGAKSVAGSEPERRAAELGISSLTNCTIQHPGSQSQCIRVRSQPCESLFQRNRPHRHPARPGSGAPPSTIVPYVRSPEKIEDLASNKSIVVIKAQLDDLDSLSKVIECADAVFSVLGPSMLFHAPDTPSAHALEKS